MKTLNFVRYAFITAAVGLFATSSDAAWTYTETEVVNGTGKGSITDGVWTFYAERAKGATDELTVDASKGMSINPAQPAKIDFSEIEDGYKVVKFVGVRNTQSPLVLYTTEFIAPHCVNLSGQEIFFGSTTLTKIQLREDAVITLGSDRMFKNCTSLSSFSPRKIANGTLQIDMFSGCSSLDGAFELTECTTIRGSAFFGCSKLGGIKAENAVSIEQSSFADCSSLSNVVMSSNIETIGVSAFSGTAISAEVAESLLGESVTLIGKYKADKLFYEGLCFRGCTAMFGELVWKMPNLATNVVPSECFKNAVLGKIVFKTPIDTFESAAFYNVRAKDNAATELYLHGQVPAQIKNNAFMRHDPPYTKVYIPDNYENWLDVIEEDKNHILIRKADFQNRGWTQNKHSSVGGWDGITKIMANDTSMCKKDGSGNSAVFEVFDKHVIGFAFVYGSSGGGCWILKKPETGFKVIVR